MTDDLVKRLEEDLRQAKLAGTVHVLVTDFDLERAIQAIKSAPFTRADGSTSPVRSGVVDRRESAKGDCRKSPLEYGRRYAALVDGKYGRRAGDTERWTGEKAATSSRIPSQCSCEECHPEFHYGPEEDMPTEEKRQPISTEFDGWQYTGAEIQSKFGRIKWAEVLIMQLPDTHDGRNSWLMNYGVSDFAESLRRKRGIVFDHTFRAAETNPPSAACKHLWQLAAVHFDRCFKCAATRPYEPPVPDDSDSTPQPEQPSLKDWIHERFVEDRCSSDDSVTFRELKGFAAELDRRLAALEKK